MRIGKVKVQRGKIRVICAMSGGIDSSVAAALLKKEGRFNVIGVFMKFWTESGQGSLAGSWNKCCSPESEIRARQVAKTLGIPFYVLNFEREFKKRVVDYFLKEYKGGRTPNPCVVCNKEIKFGLLLEKSLSLDAAFVATGHYACLQKGKEGMRLLRGKDRKKDQSYFLWQLNQKQLKHILFPVGGYSKNQVRALAKKFKLPVLNIPESQEICFVPGTLNDFLGRHLKARPGPILDAEGKKLGSHQGLPFYTIGQRKGIELSGGPFYVLAKDFKKNALIVAHLLAEEKLYEKQLKVERVNWISGKEPKLPLKIKVQIRYGHKAVLAVISKMKDAKYKILFNRPQRAITPGQSVVFYTNQEVLGGGIIC